MYSTLRSGCPTTTSPAKRQVDAVIDAACPCKTATITVTETESITKTRTKTVKVCFIKSLKISSYHSRHQQLTMFKTPTTTTTTVMSTVTPSSFYLQSSFDNNGFAYIDDQGSYYLLDFAPCDNNTALFTFNGTSLIGPDGSVANNGQCCGASGLPFAFLVINNPGITALTRAATSNILACGAGSASQSFENCYGELLLGGSHLCDATTITVATPSFS